MTENNLLFINNGNLTKEDSEENEPEVFEEKENQIPTETESELNVVQRLKNEEDISDSLKSLDGSALDNEKSGDQTNSLDQSNADSLQTLEANDADDEQSFNKTERQATPNNDAISTSDIVTHINELDGPDDYRTKECQEADEQRVLQAQANYNLSSLNYSKSNAKPSQESDSETELFDRSRCKCEEISKDPKSKTKVCRIL
ncbi:hypothetical protein M3Y97_00099300 [Aphelenchoides bicaudatus]|nr:hypothetical protein M3Y97_00099300 [Aphelenchoides bicaudatus]